METHHTAGDTIPVCEHLDAAGDCRQNINQGLDSSHLLSDSLFSEQRKLRHVLEWARRFLSGGSEVYQELCRADSLILALEKDGEKRGMEKTSPACESNEMLEGRRVWDPIPINHKNKKDNLNNNKTAAAQSSGAISENQQRSEVKGMMDDEKGEINTRLKEHLEVRLKEEESGSASTALCTNDNIRHEKEPEEMAIYCHMATPSNVSVYEQCQRKTSEDDPAPVQAPHLTSDSDSDSFTTKTKIQKCHHEAGSKKVTAGDVKEERSSDVGNQHEDRTTYMRYLEALVERGASLNLKESRALCQKNKHDVDTKKTAEARNPNDKVVNTRVERTSAALDAPKYRHIRVKGQKKTTGSHGTQRISGKSSMSSFSLSRGTILTSRPRSTGANMHTKRLDAQMHTRRNTLEDRPYRDTHTCLQPPERHTPHCHDVAPTSSASRTTVKSIVNKTDSPAGVPAPDRWLRLPDEVWLSILSLLPHTDLCRVAQACSRLHTLSTDRTLWEHLRVDNSALTERWLLASVKRRPRSLCLYNCIGLSVTPRAMETFLTLCRNDLQEVKVTSCTGPGLHGDQILPLIGQLCEHVTSVDVSWSGATDAGVSALSDGRAGLRLKSLVLNGCLFTDVPLKKLVARHKDSLVRLEVFGCQYLTPSCLHTIYQMCPGLKRLNIGQVPKVNAHSLTVMTSQLRCLISINLTGLQAVTDSIAATLLQSCTDLQSLSLCCCPGVTDLTLHNVSKYTPRIRSLDVSGCEAVTDAGVQSLSLGCSRLQHLDLSSTSTGNRGVSLLANYCNGHLHTVKLSFCHVTSENILKLLRRSQRLKVLHLYGCVHLPSETEIRAVNATVTVYPPP